ncbi:M81 family metallopeptidase [Microvirga sp. VF16]|uniref:M81 family metallopeptidase n=1 Tax=Microvirga sp. VF16 TaxID=2807101 RepID=UPI00193DBA9A|nr:M81 family metallopeptidase [Microvirga sp. VF16]QRM33076.1 M81 family metallopeptidase [Microvirga sp. VF16]
MARIAVGGFQHETNTFSPHPAKLDHFLVGAGWPGLLRGDDIERVAAGMNLPVAGGIQRLHALGHQVVPLIWTAATPSGRVTDEAFEAITSEFLTTISRHLTEIDGIYLDLHGAMATERHDDGEGEFLRRVREVVGPDLPIVCSLDLHANLSPAMFEYATALDAYRTYPHIDMRETGCRAVNLLDRVIAGEKLYKCMRRAFFTLPLTSQSTLSGAPNRLYEELERMIDADGLAAASWLGGFALADVEDAAQAVVCYGADESIVCGAADRLIQSIAAAKSEFHTELVTPAAAVRRAVVLTKEASKPVVIADVQDNPGGGGSGDTTGLLAELLAQNVENSVVAMIRDPAAVELAQQVGVGHATQFSLGGKSKAIGAEATAPVKEEFIVEKLTDGLFAGTGPMWGGSPINLGQTALLRKRGVWVIVVSNAMQAADQSIIEHVGLNPRQLSIICLKSSVHFRADFDRIASETILVSSPGLVPSDISILSYTKQGGRSSSPNAQC